MSQSDYCLNLGLRLTPGLWLFKTIFAFTLILNCIADSWVHEQNVRIMVLKSHLYFLQRILEGRKFLHLHWRAGMDGYRFPMFSSSLTVRGHLLLSAQPEEVAKMRHIRCYCFYCSQYHRHKMGQTRLRDQSVYCLSSIDIGHNSVNKSTCTIAAYST